MPTFGKAIQKDKTVGKHFVKARMVGQRGAIKRYQEFDSVKNRRKKKKLRRKRPPL